MARREAMDETGLAALVDAEIQAAVTWDASELSSDRIKAIDYERGVMADTPAPEGRSQVVSYDVRDTIEWIMPGLLRVFLATDRVGVYQPARPGDEQAAKQATDYVNHILLNDCDGFNVLHDAFRDALQVRNGYVKHWWDDTEVSETQTLANLSEAQVLKVLVNPATMRPDPDIEVLAKGPGDDPDTLNLKIRRVTSRGRLRVAVVPPEEVLINDGATSWDDVRFVAHRQIKRRSDLVREGYSREEVDEVPSYAETNWTDEKRSRLERGFTMDEPAGKDRSMDPVEYYECYVLCDYDGDGIAEWRRVCRAGPAGGRKLLHNEEWEDDLPFSDLRTGRVPHRWQGRSVFDLIHDIQRIKTVLWRQSLDNLYLQNYPQKKANLARIKNPDELFNPTLGGVIDTDDAANIEHVVTPFVAGESFGALEMLDGVIERRTGVSRQTMQLDPEVLQNQSATAAMLASNAAYSRIEMIARLLAEGGMKRLFRCLLKLVVKHQDRPRMTRLRDKFVEMDPRTWYAGMDVVINTGLGTGSRERDMAMLGQILGIQRDVIDKFGFGTPLVTPRHLYNTLARLTESAGMKDVDLFFGEIDEQTAQALAQQSGQNPEAEAKMAEMQGKMQLQQAETQAKLQLEDQRGQAEMEMARQKAMMDADATERAADRAFQAEMARINQEMQLRRYQMDQELALKREQLTAELALKRELGMVNAQVRAETAATSGVHVGGEPG